MLLGIKRQCHEINQAFNSMGFCNNVQFEHFTVSQKYHGTYSIPTVLFGRPTLISLKFFSWPILPLPAKVPKTPRERVVNGAVKWVLIGPPWYQLVIWLLMVVPRNQPHHARCSPRAQVCKFTFGSVEHILHPHSSSCLCYN